MTRDRDLKVLAKTAPKRFIIGSFIAGAGLYLATRQHPALWIPSVLLGSPFGGMACCDPGKRSESVLTSIVALAGASLILRVAGSPGTVAREWWRWAPLSIPISFLGGTAIGTLTSLFWNNAPSVPGDKE